MSLRSFQRGSISEANHRDSWEMPGAWLEGEREGGLGDCGRAGKRTENSRGSEDNISRYYKEIFLPHGMYLPSISGAERHLNEAQRTLPT